MDGNLANVLRTLISAIAWTAVVYIIAWKGYEFGKWWIEKYYEEEKRGR